MKPMKVFLLIVLALFLIVPSLADVQEKGKEDQKKMMEMWMKYATPGEGHKFLQKQVGEWEVNTKSWSQPGQEPEITKGSAKGEMIIGGRYMKMVYKGTIMGMPFQGMGIHAYDNHLKKYLSTWVDNMGTGIMVNTGVLDKNGKVLTEYAEIDDFFTGKKEKVKSVTTFINTDKWLMEMYMIGPQGEFKNLELTHIRKK